MALVGAYEPVGRVVVFVVFVVLVVLDPVRSGARLGLEGEALLVVIADKVLDFLKGGL